jgi:hypothetical protein
MSEHDDLLPPRVPKDRAQLERAIGLLGYLARGTLRGAKPELIELLGACPDAATALAWKRSLKAIRDDDELLLAIAG